ncbi:MAG: hypothetical protein JJ975_15370 [Bacteroidia bacterium]|nr:hypothetical protein [Bacteroidia bacterium]
MAQNWSFGAYVAPELKVQFINPNAVVSVGINPSPGFASGVFGQKRISEATSLRFGFSYGVQKEVVRDLRALLPIDLRTSVRHVTMGVPVTFVWGGAGKMLTFFGGVEVRHQRTQTMPVSDTQEFFFEQSPRFIVEQHVGMGYNFRMSEDWKLLIEPYTAISVSEFGAPSVPIRFGLRVASTLSP